MNPSSSQRRKNLYILGDSTACDYGPELHPRAGWGQVLQVFFDESKLLVRNHAASGRSSKSFYEEQRWQEVEDLLEPGDTVAVQFGHNDEKEDGRHTDPWTDYADFLRFYVEASRSKGADVLLVSSIPRGLWEKGRLAETHGEYPAVMRSLAVDLGVPLVDMNRLVAEHLLGLGEEGQAGFFLILDPRVSPNYPEGVTDTTHLQEAGARICAEIFARALREQHMPLAGALK